MPLGIGEDFGMAMHPLSSKIIAAIEATFAFQQLPTEVRQSYNGWAAYKGSTRITRYFFSAESARVAGEAWDSSDVPVKYHF